MLRMYAVCASIASISRKSSVSVVTLSLRQVAPPSPVRSTVAPEPLAHATLSLTALTPRKRAVTPLVCNVQLGAKRTAILNTSSPCFIRLIPGFSIQYQARLQLRRLCKTTIAIRLTFTRRLLITGILRAVLARRDHFVVRTNLTRATSLHARLQRCGVTRAQIELRGLQHLRSSGWTQTGLCISGAQSPRPGGRGRVI